MFKAASLPIALLLAGAGVLAQAGGAKAQGEGSATNNPDLLRGSIAAECQPDMLCYFGSGSDTGSSPPTSDGPVILDQRDAEPVAASGQSMAAPVVNDSAPRSDFMPAWDSELSVSLRGTYVSSGNTGRYEAQAIPRFAFSYAGSGMRAEIDGEATLVQPRDGDARLGGAEIGATAAYQLGRNTGLELGGSLVFSQDDPNALSQSSDDVAVAPTEWTGAADAALVHRFGQFEARLSGGALRSEISNTRLVGGGAVDNSADNFTRYRGGLRLGYALTPIADVFVSSSINRDVFDAASPALGASRTGWNYDLRGGIAANWKDIAGLEVSAGRAWRQFDEATVQGSQSMVYGAALTLNPNRTTALRASFDTALGAGSGASAASVDYTLALEASYKLNTLITLRGSGSASWTAPEDGSPAVRRYAAGAGADFALGEMTAMTLDYDFGWREDPAAATPERSEHRVSAGVTLQY